jgi:DNA processing protein
MTQHNIIWLLDDDPKFPHQLCSIKNPPAILYAMWNLEILSSQILWIVWPRDMSQYANQVMQALFTQIWNSNVVTVSWMARGVDHLCHQLSIGYHLPTIAILGWWLRYYRNSSARSFMEQIIQNGWLILSEFKMDFKPTAWSFPQRNRLIAGLADAVFLPEAREWSWSLITADFAYQQHKPIFVVPNPIFSENWIWSNNLVTSWKANLLSDFSPILKLFGIDSWKEKIIQSCQDNSLSSFDAITSEKKDLLKIVSHHHDEDFSQWMSEISSDFGVAMTKLTDLEMQWYVEQPTPWVYFVKVKLN